jgi:uncharacterized protein (DUF1810 family)
MYGLDGVSEAEEYLRDSLLRSRLLTIASAVGTQIESGATLLQLMGSAIDVTKLVSSMTLFGHVAQRSNDVARLPDYAALAAVASAILERAAEEGYPPCQVTRNALSNQ